MILRELRVQNFRSIRDTEPIPVSQLVVLVGENNSGRSN